MFLEQCDAGTKIYSRLPQQSSLA